MIQLVRNTHSREKNIAPLSEKYLAFTIGDEKYALDILTVQEIKRTTSTIITSKVSDAPPHLVGIFYLYDQIIPIVDLRIFFHVNPKENETFKNIIILNIAKKFVGIVVDEVLDIVDLTKDQIKSPPDFFSRINQSYIKGVGTIKENLLIIIDIEKLVRSDAMHILEHLE